MSGLAETWTGSNQAQRSVKMSAGVVVEFGPQGSGLYSWFSVVESDIYCWIWCHMFVKTVRTVHLRYAFTQIVMVRSHFHCRNAVSKYWYFSETTRSFQLASHPISDNASNQDTASKQHHSRIETTTKNMIDHMLSEQLYLFYSFHTCHTWDLINIKMLSQQWKNS